MGCASDYVKTTRVTIFDTGEIHTVADTYADKLEKHGLAMRTDTLQILEKEGTLMQIRLKRNGRVVSMPERSALSLIKTGTAEAIVMPAPVKKAVAAAPVNKMVEAAPEVKTEEESTAGEDTAFICPKCGKVYKTERGLKNHKC